MLMQEWLKILLTAITTLVGVTGLGITLRDYLETRQMKKRILTYDEHYKLLQIIEKRKELQEKGIELPPLPRRIG
ncbi:hypothetical protein HMPREF1207_03830 [Paenibacillus sp. HGH0039]|nr:hypothetical protein HMPREF1207_03830 [Paenibacillus sp. HGH0039]